MKLGMQVGLGPGHIVLDGDPAPPPQFSAHICCGQTVRWIKMPLGREIDLSPSDSVFDGDPAPPPSWFNQLSEHIVVGHMTKSSRVVVLLWLL